MESFNLVRLLLVLTAALMVTNGQLMDNGWKNRMSWMLGNNNKENQERNSRQAPPPPASFPETTQSAAPEAGANAISVDNLFPPTESSNPLEPVQPHHESPAPIDILSTTAAEDHKSNQFGIPPGLDLSSQLSGGSSAEQGASSSEQGASSVGQATYGQLSPEPYNPEPAASAGSYGGGEGGGEKTAERRTFFGGGGLSSLLPLAGAAVGALTGAATGAIGGGGGLLSLPNANIQPTLQKTFVLNLGPHNPPVVVQGNAFQPGASAGATINQAPKYYGRPGGGGGSRGRYSKAHSRDGSDGRYSAAGSHPSGNVAYPDQASFSGVAGKLGLTNVLNFAKQSGLLENLLIGGPFTLFAPSDEAFTKLPGAFLRQAGSRPSLLKNFLLYHVVSDKITTRSFTNDLVLDAMNTKKLRINLYQLGYKKIATVNGAVITRADQYVINGVIHVIDRVLFPVSNGTILDTINNPTCQPFEILGTVLAAADLFDKLQEKGPFTMFAPNVEAFALIPLAEREKILENATLVREGFLYHIVPGTYYSQGLQDGMWLDTLSSFGAPLQVGMVSDGYSRRLDSVNGAVRIVKADIPADNGVIHIVDRVITPFQTYLTCLDLQ